MGEPARGRLVWGVSLKSKDDTVVNIVYNIIVVAMGAFTREGIVCR